MKDQLALINSDGHGQPGTGGFLHFVRIGSNPNMSRVNQVTAGGQYPQDDCAPANVLSRMHDDGLNMPMTELEAICHTYGSGTGITDLMAGLQRLGYANHFLPAPPQPGWLHNSANGLLYPPNASYPYVAASTNETIIIDTPGAWEQPGPPAGDNDMLGAPTVGPDGVQRWHYRDPASGHLFEKDYDGAFHGPFDISAAHGAPSVTGGGGAVVTHADASGVYQVVVSYWSPQGFIEMYYVTGGPTAGWHGPVNIA